MRQRFIYDIETDGLLDTMTTIHSLVMYDLDTKELLSFRNDGHPDNYERLVEGVHMLANAKKRIGHNIIKFDEPALAMLFPDIFTPNVPTITIDTLTLTRLIRPNIKDSDRMRVKRGQLEGRLIGSHSLEAWGQRLGEWKGDFAKERKAEILAANPDMPKDEAARLVWAHWSPEMQSYCDQDVIANLAIYRKMQQIGYSKQAVADEMDMAYLCQRIEENGFPFNEAAAGMLYGTLAGRRAQIEDELKDIFPNWVESAGHYVPKSPNKAQGYSGVTSWFFLDDETELQPEDFTKGGLPNAAAKRRGVRREFKGYPLTKIKVVEFNPSSRIHIANRLQKIYGWKPEEFTSDGRPKVDEEVMAKLPYECAPLLVEYFTVIKRLGQLAEGQQAWLKLVRNGRVHGSYNTVGAVTRRMTHSNPNIAQVPSVGADFGAECRELFTSGDFEFLVGTDASGLELRMLAHYLARWDDGEYGDVILNGDIHTHNQNLAGLPTRNSAKTFTYALLYGSGDANLGTLLGGGATEGKAMRAKFMEGLPAYANLVTAVKKKAEMFKHINALDGGLLHVRSSHSALNTLLQSAGALCCKRWSVLTERLLIERGYKHGWDGDFAVVGNIHDEQQIAARNQEVADAICKASADAMTMAQEYYGIRIRLDVDTNVGRNWRETH